MKKFLTTLLLFLVPFFITLLAYVVLDPFMVIQRYDSFFDEKANGWVSLDKDYISTTMFDNNHQREHYNSFIFGNSRSIFYQISDWSQHSNSLNNYFHFDASGESLYALHKKVKYITSKKVKIKNALVILDFETLSLDKPRKGHLFATSPQLEDNKNLFSFHLEFFKAFLSPKFLAAYADFRISGEVKPYMKSSFLIEDTPKKYDIKTNEIRFEHFENLILKKGYYTHERKKIFFPRDTIQTFSPPVIGESQKKLLNEILEIFKADETNYKLVISPLYNQIKLNTQDLNYLAQIFGNENVFDFSGINKFTKDYTNYYETEHYRPHVSREIMTLIYQD